MEKALIAMSGGVDSSVAAYLSLQQGFACVGAMMHLHEILDTRDAQTVAEHLGIPLHILDFTQAFREQVVTDFIRSYENGRTPNPCILCNKELKFGALLQEALQLGCQYIVTGHYARIPQDEKTGRSLLCKAADPGKDQSYFLYSLDQHQLSHARFPLGELTKEEVRQIALAHGLVNARKKDSQDICFVPEGDYVAFLEKDRGAAYPAGAYLDLRGRVVGQHRGAVSYTRGQRKGLGLAMGTPVYVCSKDMAANTVTVGPESELFNDTLIAGSCNWIAFSALTEPLRCFAKVRSRMTEQPATVYPLEDGKIRVVFDTPQRAITTGQAVVLYEGELVFGGGTIEAVI